jgi:hypothetical protein
MPGRGHARSPPSLFARPRRPWAAAEAGRRACLPTRAHGPKSRSRPVDLAGPARSNKKNEFLFFFYYLKMEMVWKMFDYSNLLQICSNKFF